MREQGPNTDMDMKCPKCGKFALHTTGKGVGCHVCGYELSPGEVDRFRLFKLLREEEKTSRRRH